jgi:hypothetical protein
MLVNGSKGAMAEIIQLFRDAAFEPEAVKLLCEAYDCAVKELHDAGQPNIVYEVIAKRIIAHAKQGERDPAKLCASAIRGLGPQSVA